MARKDAFPSVICAVTNARPVLAERLREISDVLAGTYRFYEIIIVDNASTDGTYALAETLLKSVKNVQYCLLSGRVGESAAVAAGLDRAIGDCIVTMDLLADPPELLPRMIGELREGCEIVYALPGGRLRGANIYDRTARLFLRSVARFNAVNVPEAMSSYRAFTRAVLNFILDSQNFHRTLPLAPAFSGYPYTSIEYERRPEARGSGRVGIGAVLRALDILFSSSVRPLRLVTILAVGMSLFSILYAIYVVLTKIFVENVAPGWTTISLQISVFFLVTSVVIAVMSEYLLQVLEISNRRAPFHLRREMHSSVMDYEQDLNVHAAGENLPRRVSQTVSLFSGGLSSDSLQKDNKSAS
ncbi:MAG: glycosyltransferase [Alphaproteobacteria bacterium]|nr:glycosyltransferase [Alphaproteobacteria bacterium]